MKILISEAPGGYNVSFVPEFKNEPGAQSFQASAETLLKMLVAGQSEVFPAGLTTLFPAIFGERVLLDATVFPSTEQTIVSIVTDEKFKGAHNYEIKPMLRYENGPTPETTGAVYGLQGMSITFVKRNADGTWQPGIQTEQLLLVLLDRHEKLNAVFPTDVHDEFMGHLRGALDCLERRVRERTERGVMGKHEK